MSRIHTFVVVAACLPMTGCFGLNSKEAINPIPLSSPYTQEFDRARAAADDALARYYAARSKASPWECAQGGDCLSKSTPPTPADLAKYIDEGLGVVDLTCQWWFQAIAESQRRYQYTQQNTGVLTHLVTALIGVGKLSSDVTTAWGAFNTAALGFGDSFNQSYLIAPNAENVQRRVMEALAAKRSANFRTDPANPLPSTFARAEATLLDYANTCTSTQIARLANDALGDSTVTLNDMGSIDVGPSATAIAMASTVATRDSATSLANARTDILNKLSALSDEQARLVATNMPGISDPDIRKLVKASYPGDLSKAPPAVARDLARRVFSIYANDRTRVDEWASLPQLVSPEGAER